ncbi:MAG TPA: FeoA family protein, partial [Gemmatimonadales bacterium]
TYARLADVEVGERVALRQVGDDNDSERLRYLKSIGLVPQVEVTIIDRQPFGGPITLRVGRGETRDRVIGTGLAETLLVEPVP